MSIRCGYRLIAVILAMTVLSGCGRRDRGGDERNIFRYNESADITSLDPAFARDQANIWAVNQLFNGLVQLNDRLEVVPCIARSWEISADGRQYTFHLRQDVVFHDDPCPPSRAVLRVFEGPACHGVGFRNQLPVARIGVRSCSRPIR